MEARWDKQWNSEWVTATSGFFVVTNNIQKVNEAGSCQELVFTKSENCEQVNIGIKEHN